MWEIAMLDENQHEAPNSDDATGMAFAEIPYIPASALNRSPSRKRSLVVSAFLAATVIGTLVAYLCRPTNDIDPNAPRVVVDVSGMHCPIQCGLRVTSSLEKLPFVLLGSVTANPRTGVVTFATTSVEAVDQDQVRRSIENAGFVVLGVKLPVTSSGENQSDAQTTPHE